MTAPKARFPIQHLPTAYRNAAIEASRVSKLPLEMAAMSVLTATGILLRAGISAAWHHRPERRMFGNLVHGDAANTGTGKGEMESITQAPLREASKVFDKEFQEKRGILMAEKVELIAAMKHLEKGREDGDSDPTDGICLDVFRSEYAKKATRLELVRRVLESQGPILDTTDATPEGLIRALAINRDFGEIMEAKDPEKWAVVALVSPDGSDLLKWLEPVKLDDGRIESRSPVLLRAVQGEAQKPMRASHFLGRLSFSLASVSVTVTPSRLRRFLENPLLVEDGLCGRFLFQVHDGKQKLTAIDEQPVNRTVIERYKAAALGLFQRFGLALESTKILFSLEATKTLIHYRNVWVKRSWSELAEISGFTVRWAEQAGKIALVLHAMEHGTSAATREISDETTRKAVEIQSFFAEHLIGLLETKRCIEAKEIDEKLTAALEKAAREGGLKPGLAYRFGVGKTPAEGRAIVEKAVADGKAAALYTWHGNRETALVFVPDSRAYATAKREYDRVVADRKARGLSIINSLAPVSGAIANMEASEELPPLEVEPEKPDPLIEHALEVFQGHQARIAEEDEE